MLVLDKKERGIFKQKEGKLAGVQLKKPLSVCWQSIPFNARICTSTKLYLMPTFKCWPYFIVVILINKLWHAHIMS